MAISINASLHDQLDAILKNFEESIDSLRVAMEDKIKKLEERGVKELTDPLAIAFAKNHENNIEVLMHRYDKEINKLYDKQKALKIDKFLKKFTKSYPAISFDMLQFIALDPSDAEIDLVYHTSKTSLKMLEFMTQAMHDLQVLNDDIELINKMRNRRGRR